MNELERFQEGHTNHLGKPLAVDGILGQQTRWARDIASMCPERRAIVSRAISMLGVTEDPPGSNRGLRIDEWLQRCDAGSGQPWCAAFASWCLGKVAIASAQTLGGRFPGTMNPIPGDVMWYPTSGWQGHCGIVTGANATEVMTVEGNNAHAVRCVRRPRLLVRFCRTVSDISGSVPEVVLTVSLSSGGTR